jgi:glycosyltransferase involved in cell wall biosynthesis
MKICLVNNLLTPWSRGGAEKVIETLAEAIIQDGHEVFFISTKPPKTADPEKNKTTHYYLPSHYHSLNKWSHLRKLAWHLLGFIKISQVTALKKILVDEKPDLIITNNLIGIGFALGRLAQGLKIKHFHILHDIQLLHPSGLLLYGQVGELATPLAKYYQRLTKQQLGHPQVVIAPSHWLMNEHLKRGFFAPRSSDFSGFNTSTQVVLANPSAKLSDFQQQTKDTTTFLFVGQIEKHKGVQLLIQAWTDFINRTKAETKLIVVGDGSYLNLLSKLKAPRVEFKGRLVGRDLTQVYAQATCLVVPSLCYENSPTVIYEATQAGLPVIASRLGGTKELLNKDYLFKPEVNALSDKLFWAYKKRHELVAPQIKLINPKEYWAEIKKYVTQ